MSGWILPSLPPNFADTLPEPTLNKAQEAEVKRVAKALLKTLKKEKLVLDWRARQQSRAAVRQFIEIELDKLPEVYTPGIFETKCDLAYRHVFDHYVGPSESVYHPGVIVLMKICREADEQC
jgi:type I restriction enzyme R subunit